MEKEKPLTIKVYEPDGSNDERLKILPSQIPKPRFSIAIIGSTGSGKSNLIKNMIYNWYKEYFSEIYIFCGSLDDCDEYEKLGDKTKCKMWNRKKGQLYKTKKMDMSDKIIIEREPSEASLTELYNDLEEEQHEEGKKLRTLFLFDDQITSGLFRSRGNTGIINKIQVQGRHINLSVIYTSQKYKMLPQNARSQNITHLILFNGMSKNEIEVIAKEHSGHLSDKEFIALYNETTKEPFSFLIINLRNPRNKRFQNSKFEYL